MGTSELAYGSTTSRVRESGHRMVCCSTRAATLCSNDVSLCELRPKYRRQCEGRLQASGGIEFMCADSVHGEVNGLLCVGGCDNMKCFAQTCATSDTRGDRTLSAPAAKVVPQYTHYARA